MFWKKRPVTKAEPSEAYVTDLGVKPDAAKFVFQQVSDGLKETETTRGAVDGKATTLLASSTAASSALLIFVVKEADKEITPLVVSVACASFCFLAAVLFAVGALWPRQYLTTGTKAEDWFNDHPESLTEKTLSETILRWCIRYEARRKINNKSNLEKQIWLSRGLVCFGTAPFLGVLIFLLPPLRDALIRFLNCFP